ncbi:MAG: TatD family hydrolase [Candidatus Levybacteria bacterium]|nr:TatD family hydrolase [Candidatus Levybacteria bacterium]
MIDVHCHLNFHAFEKDYDEVIKSAFKAGVTKIINVGTKIDSSFRAVEMAQKYPQLYAIVGVHPHHADKLEAGWELELEKLAKNPKVVAIGEIGIDYFRYKSNSIVDPKLQKETFIKQIILANKLKLPLQIHNRLAGKDILDILENHKPYLLNPPGMFHCMSGDLDSLKKVLDLGFYIGFDGNITYSGLAPGETVELKELVSYAPLDRIVTETDSPFLTPEPMRGVKNRPEYVIIIGEFISKLRGINFDKLRNQTTKNVKKIFSI